MDTQYILLLRNIIEAHLNRREGYKKAKKLTKSYHFLTYLFDQCIKQSDTYIERLNNMLIMQEIKATTHTPILGFAFKCWIQVKFYFSRNKNNSLVHSCLRAEEILLLHYDYILDNNIEDYYFPLLKKNLEVQRKRIAFMHQKLKDYLESKESISLNHQFEELALSDVV